jgi:hypothetical protein
MGKCGTLFGASSSLGLLLCCSGLGDHAPDAALRLSEMGALPEKFDKLSRNGE